MNARLVIFAAAALSLTASDAMAYDWNCYYSTFEYAIDPVPDPTLWAANAINSGEAYVAHDHRWISDLSVSGNPTCYDYNDSGWTATATGPAVYTRHVTGVACSGATYRWWVSHWFEVRYIVEVFPGFFVPYETNFPNEPLECGPIYGSVTNP